MGYDDYTLTLEIRNSFPGEYVSQEIITRVRRDVVNTSARDALLQAHMWMVECLFERGRAPCAPSESTVILESMVVKNPGRCVRINPLLLASTTPELGRYWGEHGFYQEDGLIKITRRGKALVK